MTSKRISASVIDSRRARPSRPWAISPARSVRSPSRISQAGARVLDVTLAALLIAVLAVPMLVIALLIKLTSRGPAIYSQERTGWRGRTFVMYKFRTMRVDAEAETGPIWATREDPRRTRLGVILRRLSLDELPQLFNVLAGDMSMVGPRPERPCFVKSFAQRLPAYNERHAVRPGMTGWAQINGWRGDSSIEERLECDLYYVRHRSLWFNVRILLLTPLRVLVERNAC
ncbi:MAG: exopolysaccharide biosynthesis polyprenyl glycosylphosphotransferase [Pirellulales bacterium]